MAHSLSMRFEWILIILWSERWPVCEWGTRRAGGDTQMGSTLNQLKTMKKIFTIEFRFENGTGISPSFSCIHFLHLYYFLNPILKNSDWMLIINTSDWLTELEKAIRVLKHVYCLFHSTIILWTWKTRRKNNSRSEKWNKTIASKEPQPSMLGPIFYSTHDSI